jgi:hypothetical protein
MKQVDSVWQSAKKHIYETINNYKPGSPSQRLQDK